MYDEKYAKAWIASYESEGDKFRVQFLEPFLRKKIQELPESSKILDIGCGWGTAVKFLKPSHKYYGIDPVRYFFKYIKKRFKHPHLILKEGKLPDKINFEDENFDFVICSLVLHTLPNIKEPVNIIFSKVNKRGKILIIDFRDSAEKALREEVYDPIYEEDEKHIKGLAIFPFGIKILGETWFHKEKEIEDLISKYGEFDKEYLGPFFVAYTVSKDYK